MIDDHVVIGSKRVFQKKKPGMLFSWHKVIAVISITERSFEVTSWYVSDSRRRAFGFLLGSSSKTPSTFVAFSTTSALTVVKSVSL